MSSVQSTESRGALLWRKMSAIYGARFLDLWANVDPREVQAEWSAALHAMPRDAIQRGIAGLYHAKYPPTLPEFLAMCAPHPAMYAARPALTDEQRTAPPEARARLADIAGTITKRLPPGNEGISWARRIVESARTSAVPAMKLAIASEAIRTWETTHPAREREPGDDDEPVTEV